MVGALTKDRKLAKLPTEHITQLIFSKITIRFVMAEPGKFRVGAPDGAFGGPSAQPQEISSLCVNQPFGAGVVC